VFGIALSPPPQAKENCLWAIVSRKTEAGADSKFDTASDKNFDVSELNFSPPVSCSMRPVVEKNAA
jgi:hypothetical protein